MDEKMSDKEEMKCGQFIRNFCSQKDLYTKEGYGLECSVIKSFDKLWNESIADDIISCLNNSNLSSPVYELALSYAYIRTAIGRVEFAIWGEKTLNVKIIWDKDNFIKPLENIKHLDNYVLENPMVCLLAAFCNEMLGEYIESDKLIANFQKLVNQEKNRKDKEYIRKTENMLDATVTLKHAEKKIQKGTITEINDVKKNLESIIAHAPDHHIANALLIYVYKRLGQMDEYILLLHKWLEYWPDAFVYEALGRIYLRLKDYNQASLYLKEASKAYYNNHKDTYRQDLCLALAEFSLGLKSLSSINLAHRPNMSSSHKYFYKCSTYLNNSDIEEMDDLKIFPSILEISHRTFTLFSSSNNLYELKSKVINLLSISISIFSQWKSPEQYRYAIYTIGDPASDLLLLISDYLDYVGSILKIAPVLEHIKFVLEKIKKTETEYWQNAFRIMNQILEEDLNFKAAQEFLNTLHSFKNKIKERAIEDIPDDEGKLILDSLKAKSENIEDIITNSTINIMKDKSFNIGQVIINIGEQEPAAKDVKRKSSRSKKVSTQTSKHGEKTHDKTFKVKAAKKLKPFKPEDEKFIELRKQLKDINQDFLNKLVTAFGVDKSIYGDMLFERWMKDIVDNYENVIKSKMPILIKGESGVGKSYFAKILHIFSGRPEKTFVKRDCSTYNYSETLFENDVFGHEPGAYTGAHSKKEGALESANTGTFCFENIEDLPRGVQDKMRLFIDDGCGYFNRVGGSEKEKVKVDVRIISTCVKDLKELVKQKQFSSQLCNRIDPIVFEIPTLSERFRNIPKFISLYIEKWSGEQNRNIKWVSKQLYDFAKVFSWRDGNLRRLKNSLDATLAISKGEKVSLEKLLLTFSNKDWAIAETWQIYGFDFDKLNARQKQILVKGFNVTVDTQTIARKFRMSKQTVNPWLRELEQKGFLKLVGQYNKGGVNHYSVRFPCLLE